MSVTTTRTHETKPVARSDALGRTVWKCDTCGQRLINTKRGWWHAPKRVDQARQ